MAIDRREALRRTAMIMGGALSAPSIMAVLNGCTAKPELNWTPSFFNEEQAILIMELAEDIIPQTATPGAKALGRPRCIEEMVGARFAQDDRDKFMAGLAQFDQDCLAATGDTYLDLDLEHRVEYLKKLNAEINKNIYHARFTPNKEKTFFWMLKELTLTGYFTTEVGATQVLQHKAIPQEYKGCVTLYEAGGRTWATS